MLQETEIEELRLGEEHSTTERPRNFNVCPLL